MIQEEIQKLIIKDTKSTDEEDTLIDYFTSERENLDSKEWVDAIFAITMYLEKHSIKKSIPFISGAYSAFVAYHPRLFSHRGNILKHLCKLYIRSKDIDNAMCVMREYMYCRLAACAAKCDTYPGIRYYSFRSFSDYSLKEISDEIIYASHPRTFNDPIDTVLHWWLDARIKRIKTEGEIDDEFYIVMKKIVEHIKIRCLISAKDRRPEDLSVLMWSHYAKNHTGFCVEYELPESLFSNLNSTDSKLCMIRQMNYTESVDVVDEPTIVQSLFTKTEEWSYEQETRLVLYDPTNHEEFPYVEAKGFAKAVYLGVKCSDENRIKMEKAVGDKYIPIFQMNIDTVNAGKFTKTRIG